MESSFTVLSINIFHSFIFRGETILRSFGGKQTKELHNIYEYQSKTKEVKTIFRTFTWEVEICFASPNNRNWKEKGEKHEGYF